MSRLEIPQARCNGGTLLSRAENRCFTMFLTTLREWARSIRRDVHALYLASRDPRVPWPAKAVAVCVAAYALSPIDLIPDFVPVFGYLDDVIIVPLGIMLAVRLIPAPLMAEHRAAAALAETRRASRAGAAAIVAIWTAAILLAVWLIWRHFSI
jgi:uncharacterized membrane protein YkvA (DUF1232 family)